MRLVIPRCSVEDSSEESRLSVASTSTRRPEIPLGVRELVAAQYLFQGRTVAQLLKVNGHLVGRIAEASSFHNSTYGKLTSELHPEHRPIHCNSATVSSISYERNEHRAATRRALN